MILKICGITRLEDAELAVALGATALGFIFWPGSPRRIDVSAAAAITGRLPASVLTVGVFVDADVDEIERTAEASGVGAVQLHGSEDPLSARRLSRRVIKALAMTEDDRRLDALAETWKGSTLLLDAHDPVRRGGTGSTVDWPRAARIASRQETILAGGLHAGNVAEAIRIVRPAGIDVSSGVEHSPGIKDPAKLAAFCSAVATVEVPS